MKSLLKCIPTYPNVSYALLTEIINLPKLPANAKLFTADTTTMYANISTDTALVTFNLLFEHCKEEIPSDFQRALFLAAVLEIVMKKKPNLMILTGSKKTEPPYTHQQPASMPPQCSASTKETGSSQNLATSSYSTNGFLMKYWNLDPIQ